MPGAELAPVPVGLQPELADLVPMVLDDDFSLIEQYHDIKNVCLQIMET